MPAEISLDLSLSKHNSGNQAASHFHNISSVIDPAVAGFQESIQSAMHCYLKLLRFDVFNREVICAVFEEGARRSDMEAKLYFFKHFATNALIAKLKNGHQTILMLTFAYYNPNY